MGVPCIASHEAKVCLKVWKTTFCAGSVTPSLKPSCSIDLQRILKALKIKGRDFAAYQSTYKRETLIVEQLKVAKLLLEECGERGNREKATELVSYEKSELLSNESLNSKRLEFQEEQKIQLGEFLGIDTVKTIHDKHMGRKAKKRDKDLQEFLSNLPPKED